MKLTGVLSLMLVGSLAQQALAEDQASSSPEARGIAEAIINNCAHVDPEHAAEYQSVLQALDQDMSSEALAEMRNTDQYQQAYNSTSNSMAQVKAPEAVKTCRKSLTSPKK